MNSVVFKIAVAASVVLFAACGGRQENRKGEKLDFGSATMDAGKSIVGEWDIVGIMCGDSIAISPAETMPGVDVAMELAADETYVVRTGCNTISGSYASRGNSIKFTDGMMTEMACDDMAVEDALRQLLPEIEYCELSEDGAMATLSASDSRDIIRLTRKHD